MNIVFSYRIIHALFALITLYFITQYLSPEDQGWYYTFLSLSALIYLFDFGLSSALIHISAIKFTKYKWKKNGLIDGEDANSFQDFINLSFFKYLRLSLYYFLILFPFGIYYFSESNDLQYFFWIIPWIIHCLVASLNLLCLPFLSIVEGSGNIKEIYTLRIFHISLGTLLCCLLIYFNYPLIAPSMVLLSLFLVTFLWLVFYRKNNLPKFSFTNNKYEWEKDTKIFKNKIGITFLGAYLVAQIYTPILFYFENSTVAGQFGLSLAIANMLGLISNSWITVNIPSMTKAITEKEYAFFSHLFKKSFFQSSIFIIFATFITIILYILFDGYNIINRVVEYYNFIGILVIIIMNHFISAIVIYLRCFKEEPLVVIHFICSVLTLLLGTYFLINYSIAGLIMIILLIQIFLILPISIVKLRKFIKNI